MRELREERPDRFELTGKTELYCIRLTSEKLPQSLEWNHLNLHFKVQRWKNHVYLHAHLFLATNQSANCAK